MPLLEDLPPGQKPPIAGIRTNKDESIKGCMALQRRAETPPKVRKWRKSMYSEPGQRVLHPGQIEDARALASKDRTYGVSSKGLTHVEPVHYLKHGRATGPPSEALDLKTVIQECMYVSSKREPLGRSAVRGHVLPESIAKNTDFRFGVSSSLNESVKDLMYPHIESDDSAYKSMYIKSHRAYEPGEQRRRDYSWKVDPEKYRFGIRGSTVPFNGISTSVASILHGEPEEPSRTVGTVSQVNFQFTQDRLGKAKALGNRPADVGHHVFGRPSVRRTKNDWDAKACIHGDYSWEEQQPEEDLSKSITPGFRNLTADTRAYGVPSIRTDIKQYARRSLADSQNYGDEKGAAFLLQPSQFAAQGVEDEEFEKLREKEELTAIFTRLGYSLSNEEIDIVFNRAMTRGPDAGLCSIHTFRNVLNDMLAAKENNAYEQWLSDSK